MKKLICAEDITKAHEEGKTTLCIDKGTIITPSARDLVEEYHITLETCECPVPAADGLSLPADLTKESFVLMLKALLAGDTAVEEKPYIYRQHENGLKSVKGSSVKMDVFDTGDPTANVHFQELISKEEAKISAGFLEIDHSSFDWELTYEEIDYVIEGTLQVTIDGVTYTAKAGDVLFVPKNSKVTWGSPDKAKIFYATYPANWADLV